MFIVKNKKISKALSFLIVFCMTFVAISFSSLADAKAADTLKVYSAPSGITLSTLYTVKVRVPGGQWESLDSYITTIGGYSAKNGAFVYFDCNGAVELSVTNNGGNIASAQVRSLNKTIKPTIVGNTMTFSISGPMDLAVDINGSVNTELNIFANPLETDVPSPNDPNVIYLGPGVYNGDITVPSGKTLYIAGGAVVKGGVNLDNDTNSKVIGRGVLYYPSAKGVSADYANQITIDGIIIDDFGHANNGGCAVALGNSSNVTINNLKAYSFQRWTDGIDTFSSSYISINDVFLRTGDDAIAIYGSRSNGGRIWAGNSTHISVTNSILTPDVAHAVNVGTHGDSTEPGGGDTLDTLSFTNLAIWGNNSIQPISLTSSDGNLVTNVKFTNISIDDRLYGKFVDITTFQNGSFSTAPGRGINNVYFKNITYNGTNANTNQIYGNSATRLTQNVTFQNLKVDGEVIQSASDGNFNVGNYTSNIQFIPSGTSVATPTPLPSPTPINLALDKAAYADGSAAKHSPAAGNDSSTGTGWSAGDSATGHWWMVDLGTSQKITGGVQIRWAKKGIYQYKIETSNDGSNWTVKADETQNTKAASTQTDFFLDTARYVRFTITGLPASVDAGFNDFEVLGDATNLALGKTALADSSQPDHQAADGIDGNATTYWSTTDGAAGHSLTVNLGESMDITHGTQVSWTKNNLNYKYKVETSNDGVNWTLRADKTRNSSKAQVQTDYFTATARYVKITITGVPTGEDAGLADFKVIGDAANLALGKTASSDSEQAANPVSAAVDGSTATRWCANDGNTGHWWMVDLGSNVKITNGTQVMWENGGVAYKYKIETSTDGTNWTLNIDKTINATGSQGNTNTNQVQADYFTATARYVRITVTGLPSGAYASFYEFRVLGQRS